MSTYKANCKESAERVIMDKTFSLPCHQNFIGSCDDLVREILVSSLPSFPGGVLLNLQVHGNQNSMMQNIKIHSLLFAFDYHNFHHSYWC